MTNTTTTTNEYTDEDQLLSELLGIIARAELDPVDWQTPSDAEGEDGHVFSAHHGGILIGLPRYLILADVGPSPKMREAAGTRLMALVDAAGGSHWAAEPESPVNGIIEVADQAELEAALSGARAWLVEGWNADENFPAPPVQWGGPE